MSHLQRYLPAPLFAPVSFAWPFSPERLACQDSQHRRKHYLLPPHPSQQCSALFMLTRRDFLLVLAQHTRRGLCDQRHRPVTPEISWTSGIKAKAAPFYRTTLPGGRPGGTPCQRSVRATRLHTICRATRMKRDLDIHFKEILGLCSAKTRRCTKDHLESASSHGGVVQSVSSQLSECIAHSLDSALCILVWLTVIVVHCVCLCLSYDLRGCWDSTSGRGVCVP